MDFFVSPPQISRDLQGVREEATGYDNEETGSGFHESCAGGVDIRPQGELVTGI